MKWFYRNALAPLSMVLSETQIPLVAHTAALRVYLSLAYDPIGAFFTHSLEHHHTIYHLPLSPWGTNC